MFDPKKGGRAGNQSDDWRADAFLNLFIPRKNGSRMKLGFCALKSTNVDQAKLIEWLREDPEARIAALISKLVIEFHEVGSQDESDLDL